MRHEPPRPEDHLMAAILMLFIALVATVIFIQGIMSCFG